MADGDSPIPLRATDAFRSRNFRLYQSARLMVILGAEAQAVAVAWQVYQITHSALKLGLTGLALFLPGVFCMLAAGHVADLYERRNIILLCYALQAVCTGVLLWLSLTPWTIANGRVWPIYAVLIGIGISRAFSGPASSALLPSLVPKEHFVNAVTWGATVFQVANMSGPAVGGLLFTLPLIGVLRGAPVVYIFTLIMLAGFLVLISMIRPAPIERKPTVFNLRTMLAGLEYVWTNKLLLGSISLDLFAVMLGGAVALLPIFATDILHAGPRGLGLLRAMPSVGALLVSLLLVVKPIKRRAGKTMLMCVALYGAATIIFGLSKHLQMSLLALFILGAADMFSVVVRSSMLQLATPPEMRGRVSAVNWLFVGASNEFGEFESGLTASWWGAVPAVVVGGIASLCVTATASIIFPRLRRADALTAESLLAAEQELATAEPRD
ncbi:MAG: MFS transporter [Edaphobacter sp.]|uniref:MFS transporter n=1 Tax=Edaphobacter sp. TaxID=1934404 RepID=UPI00239B3422|nr:MFS transporter [Edaphobacter sp.]MDE1176954.1 MFS transporter [Edaphobacter sp.]